MDDYLRFEILKYLADNGRSSKIMVEKAFGQHKHITKTNRSVRHHRPDILDDFEFLRTEGSIVKLNTDPGQGKVYKRGRPQEYYVITEYGLKKLIADKRISKTQFWQVISHYCFNIDSVLTLDKIEELLLIFMNNYVKYRYHGFALYSEDSLKVCNNLFKERIQISGRISVFQKVLEVLAIIPKIAFNELVKKVGESESKVNKVLSLYSCRPRSLQDIDIIKNDYGKENSDFIAENIITVNYEGSDGLTYELSIFGVMLTLLVILYNGKRKLKQGLYLKEYSFEEYFDKIAHNYNRKLPLIFGKWAHLRRILQVFAIYNFDVVLLDEPSNGTGSSSFSVNAEGNEKAFHGIRTIIQYNKSLMQDLVKSGREALGDYISVRFDLDAVNRLRDDEKFNKINPVCAILEEIAILANPLWYRYPRLSFVTFTTLNPNRILNQMEEALAEEISAFYYMNLFNNNIKKGDSSKDLTLSLERISLLFQEDKRDPLIGDWVSKWTKDLSGRYKDLSDRYKQISETVEGWSST